jgi:hypothetical protein
MNQGTPLSLSSWQNFYVIVGAAAGALTGLQFVVLTLVAQARAASSIREIRAFGTPTVVHFCTALVVSAAMAAPWQSLAQLGVCLAIGGALGVVYSLSIFWHARKAAYNPDLEDWIWYTALPLLAHIALVAAAIILRWNATGSLCAVAVDSVAFLILGIHNSWDTVTYVALNHTSNPVAKEKRD